ncbi:MAG: chaperonin GroEL [Bacteroidota bacterium]
MSKKIIFGLEATKKAQLGVDKLADAVKSTLGPGGKTVVIEKKFGAPHITKDGVSVAKEIEFEDPIENAGAQLVKEVASKTNDDAGDGTTTATLLTQSMLQEGIKNITSGTNPIDLTHGMSKAVDHVQKVLKKQAKSISGLSGIEQIATISANNDHEMGKMIAGAMDKVGHKGVVTVEEGKGTETEVNVVEGMQFDRGYHSPHFVTNAEKMVAELDDPYILITDQKITNLKSMLHIVESVAKTGKPLFIIAEDIDGPPLGFLVLNKLHSALKCCFVKAPGFGDHRKAMLEDIATLTGGTVISEERGYKLENTTLDYLGGAKKIKVDKENTIIVDGLGKKDKVQAKVAEIELQIKQSTSEYDKEKLQERMAKLSQGVAVIHVGAPTEVEMKEKKDRVTDALNATRAAIEEGVLPGGGIALLRASQSLDDLKGKNEDEQTGIKIIQKALEAPLYTILANALGTEQVYPIMHKIKEGKEDYGYNVHSHTYGALHSLGVIDPAKVTRLALDNAASIVSLLIKTGCIIVDQPKAEKPNTPPAMPGGGMPDMM